MSIPCYIARDQSQRMLQVERAETTRCPLPKGSPANSLAPVCQVAALHFKRGMNGTISNRWAHKFLSPTLM